MQLVSLASQVELDVLRHVFHLEAHLFRLLELFPILKEFELLLGELGLVVAVFSGAQKAFISFLLELAHLLADFVEIGPVLLQLHRSGGRGLPCAWFDRRG